jgi:type IV pilus assembly protein PilV
MTTTMRFRQSGATLLEALVAVLIFSIGILALVGIQATAVKNASDAKYRADASYLADQLIGQIWADRTNIAQYSHLAAAGPNACTPGGAASAYANAVTWLSAVAKDLPNAPATRQQIVVAAGNVVTVTVCWQVPGENVLHDFTETAQING